MPNKKRSIGAVEIMAKDLVRTRRQCKEFKIMRAMIQAVSLKIQTMKSQNSMAIAMKDVTKAMQKMNKQMKLPRIQKIVMEFEKQTDLMDMNEEILSDAMGEMSMADDDEGESEAIVTQALDELGLQLIELPAIPAAAKNSLAPLEPQAKTKPIPWPSEQTRTCKPGWRTSGKMRTIRRGLILTSSSMSLRVRKQQLPLLHKTTSINCSWFREIIMASYRSE